MQNYVEYLLMSCWLRNVDRKREHWHFKGLESRENSFKNLLSTVATLIINASASQERFQHHPLPCDTQATHFK